MKRDAATDHVGRDSYATGWIRSRLFSDWGSVLAIARAYNTSAYDAAYLELAIRRGLPLATIDDKLKPAAGKAGVKLYQPKKRKSS